MGFENVPPPIPQRSSSSAYAIVSLILGILSVLLSLFTIGIIFGLLGMIFGIAHIRRGDENQGMAWTGTALSGLGTLISLAMIAMVASVMTMMDGMADSDWARWEGVTAPDISVSTLVGETLTLSDLRGKRVMLDFWATWCPPCVEEIPHFIDLTNEFS